MSDCLNSPSLCRPGGSPAPPRSPPKTAPAKKPFVQNRSCLPLFPPLKHTWSFFGQTRPAERKKTLTLPGSRLRGRPDGQEDVPGTNCRMRTSESYFYGAYARSSIHSFSIRITSKRIIRDAKKRIPDFYYITKGIFTPGNNEPS